MCVTAASAEAAGLHRAACRPSGSPAEGSTLSTPSPPASASAAPAHSYLYQHTSSLAHWRKSEEKMKYCNKKRERGRENETIIDPWGVLLFVLTQRTSYAN